MTKRLSVADVRKALPSILDQVEMGAEVELTRRGKPVAVLVSVHEYERLRSGRASFASTYASFVKRYALAEVGLPKDFASEVRSREGGRLVKL